MVLLRPRDSEIGWYTRWLSERNRDQCGCIDDHLVWATQLVVAQDLFRSAQPLRQAVGGRILDAEGTRLSLPHEVIVRQSQGYNRTLAYFFVPNNTLTLVSPFSVPTVTTTVRFVAVSSAEIMPPDAVSVLPVMLAVIPKPDCFRFCP
jgi:hypothetical protein